MKRFTVMLFVFLSVVGAVTADSEIRLDYEVGLGRTVINYEDLTANNGFQTGTNVEPAYRLNAETVIEIYPFFFGFQGSATATEAMIAQEVPFILTLQNSMLFGAQIGSFYVKYHQDSTRDLLLDKAPTRSSAYETVADSFSMWVEIGFRGSIQ